jgi:hypothetical protein
MAQASPCAFNYRWIPVQRICAPCIPPRRIHYRHAYRFSDRNCNGSWRSGSDTINLSRLLQLSTADQAQILAALQHRQEDGPRYSRIFPDARGLPAQMIDGGGREFSPPTQHRRTSMRTTRPATCQPSQILMESHLYPIGYWRRQVDNLRTFSSDVANPHYYSSGSCQ